MIGGDGIDSRSRACRIRLAAASSRAERPGWRRSPPAFVRTARDARGPGWAARGSRAECHQRRGGHARSPAPSTTARAAAPAPASSRILRAGGVAEEARHAPAAQAPDDVGIDLDDRGGIPTSPMPRPPRLPLARIHTAPCAGCFPVAGRRGQLAEPRGRAGRSRPTRDRSRMSTASIMIVRSEAARVALDTRRHVARVPAPPGPG